MKEQSVNSALSNVLPLYLIEDQCLHRPEAVAVCWSSIETDQDNYLTYGELDSRANQLAHFLRAQGVGPEVVVALFMERAVELVVAVVGVLKAGGAYVPLDPTTPPERLAFMLKDTQASVILTQERMRKQLPNHQAHLICLDTDWETIAQEPITRPLEEVRSGNMASVLYTSGSTGQPKAVMRPYNHIPEQQVQAPINPMFTPHDRHLFKSSLGVVAFNSELFRPLRTGGELVIVPAGKELDPAYLVKFIAKYQITVVDLVPSMLRLLLDEPVLETCTSLKWIICAGETLPLYLQEYLFSRLKVTLYSFYGTTESPGAVSWKRQPGNSQPAVVGIGRPEPNRQIYLLDASLQAVPEGVPGELYIAGGLARGYLNRPDLTAERFIPNPFSDLPGERMYKTGDLGRYLADGTIELLGRVDDQVQIRGFRVEPGEIEAALVQHPDIKTAVVLAQDSVREPDQKHLVAYVIPKPEASPQIGELRHFLQQKLPRYMAPAAIMVLDALPLLPNGKINRLALPVPGTLRPELEEMYIPPRNLMEEKLAAIWAEVLRLEQVGIHDNFFELGGHSLLAAQLITRIREAFSVELSLFSLFEKQTIAELAVLVEKGGDNQVRSLNGKTITLDEALRLLEDF